MNKSEIQETLERYFSKESNTVKYKGTGELVKKLVDMFSKGVTHFGDAPDMYITSPIGAMAIDNKRKVVPIELGACREFLEIMKLYKGVDAVIACSEVSQTQFVWFISNDEIDTYIEQSSEYKLMQFMDFTPHVIGMKVVIPDK